MNHAWLIYSINNILRLTLHYYVILSVLTYICSDKGNVDCEDPDQLQRNVASDLDHGSCICFGVLYILLHSGTKSVLRYCVINYLYPFIGMLCLLWGSRLAARLLASDTDQHSSICTTNGIHTVLFKYSDQWCVTTCLVYMTYTLGIGFVYCEDPNQL